MSRLSIKTHVSHQQAQYINLPGPQYGARREVSNSEDMGRATWGHSSIAPFWFGLEMMGRYGWTQMSPKRASTDLRCLLMDVSSVTEELWLH